MDNGYLARLADLVVGFGANVQPDQIVAVTCEPGKEPLVRECWMLSGEIDFILKCVAPDLKTFQAFVERLTAAPHVRNVKTSLTLRNSKDDAIVPLGKPAS